MTRFTAAVMLPLLVLACAGDTATESAGDLVVQTPSRTLRLSPDDWQPLAGDDEQEIVRLQQLHREPRQPEGRVVTVFRQPMTPDQRIGTQVATGEFVQMFVVQPGRVTVQVRLDRGDYWVMSRETFAMSSAPGVDIAGRWHPLEDDEFDAAAQTLRQEIEASRNLLRESF